MITTYWMNHHFIYGRYFISGHIIEYFPALYHRILYGTLREEFKDVPDLLGDLERAKGRLPAYFKNKVLLSLPNGGLAHTCYH